LLGVDSLPATLIFDYPTPDAVAGYLLARLQGEGPSESAGETSAPLPVVREKLLTAEEVGDLSEEDVAELLRSRLA
jgi:hypothetical protein